jgi:hypothetical protein
MLSSRRTQVFIIIALAQLGIYFAQDCSEEKTCGDCSTHLNCIWLQTSVEESDHTLVRETLVNETRCILGTIFGPRGNDSSYANYTLTSSNYYWKTCSVNAFEMLLIICAVGVLVVIALIVVGFVIALKCRSNKYTRLNDGWDEYLEEQRLQFAADTREQQRLEAQRAAEEREKERQRQRKNFPTKWKRNNNQ